MARCSAVALALVATAACATPTVPAADCELSEPGVDAPATIDAARVIYLDRDGARLTGGTDNAARGVSSIVAGHGEPEVTIPAATLDDAAWADVVTCVRQAYARFNVEIVDRRPADAGYMTAVFGGTGTELGLGTDSKGIAPIDSTSCETIDDAVVFVFTDNLANDVTRVCETAAHEIAHVFSVDHEYLAADLSSYLSFSGRRSFQDVDAACGEDVERECICGRASQNAVEILLDRLGPATSVDRDPPTIEVSTAPSSRGSLAITVTADDPAGIAAVSLTYRDDHQAFTSTCGDGQVQCTTWGADRKFVIVGAAGHAVFHAEAIDVAGNAAATPPAETSIDGAVTTGTPAITAELRDGASPGIVEVIATVAAAEAGREIASVALFWTDDRGVTVQAEMCETDAGQWSLLVEPALRSGPRTLVIEATDDAGHTGLATLTTVR